MNIAALMGLTAASVLSVRQDRPTAIFRSGDAVHSFHVAMVHAIQSRTGVRYDINFADAMFSNKYFCRTKTTKA